MGRRRFFNATIEFSGSAGWTSGVSAEIFTDRFRRGSVTPFAPTSLNAGQVQRVAALMYDSGMTSSEVIVNS